MKVFEVLSGIDPKEAERTIKTSFKDRVVSDLLADETHKGELVDARQMIEQLKAKFPSLMKQAKLVVKDNVERIRIHFNPDGSGAMIEVPSKLKTGLGEVLVLHEIAHMLYTKDLLTNKIIKYRDAPQAFTILRVLEDISIEQKLEAEYPNAVEVFKGRVQHILPIYKNHKPSNFASKVDQLFLFLRGYTSRPYSESHSSLSAAHTYLNSDDPQEKIDAVLKITEDFMRS